MTEEESGAESELAQPEEKFIEKVHNNTPAILESDVKSLKSLNKYYFQTMFSDYLYEINFPKDSKLEIVGNLSFCAPGKISHLYSIKFPPSIKEIATYALYKCIFVDQITFLKDENEKNNLELLQLKAFLSTKIQSINIPENIKSIGSYCFPPTLESITFEKGTPKLEKVENKAFCNTKIEKILMPLNIKPFVQAQIAFFRCNQLKTIVFDSYYEPRSILEEEEEEKEVPNLKEKIQNYKGRYLVNCVLYSYARQKAHDYAQSYLLSQTKVENLDILNSDLKYFYFYNTPKLTNISIKEGDDCTYVKHEGCLYTINLKKLVVAERNIKETTIKSKCKIISNYAFNFDCFEKVSFEKNSELQIISIYAFSESNIQSIEIPETVDIIDLGAFYNCTKLKEAKIPPLLENLSAFSFFNTKLTEITIPKSVLIIENSCFCKCSNLNKVVFEKDSELIEIHIFAFAFTNIETISIPKSVEILDDYCFKNCTKLKSIEIDPDSKLQRIGCECFSGTLIEKFELPRDIKELDLSNAKAKEIIFNEFSPVEIIDFESTQITQISIPPSVKRIHSFYECPNLTSVKIINIEDSKLEYINNEAFYNCSSLTEFDLPQTVNYFGACCFKNCIKYEVKICICKSDNPLILIKQSAFENTKIISFESSCKKLKINDYAFKDCSNLSTFNASASHECYLGKSAFLNCTSLKNVKLLKETGSVGICDNCFENTSIETFDAPLNLYVIPDACFKSCKKLVNINISEDSNLNKFGDESFYETKIQSIYIPTDTNYIGKKCFEKCKNLKKVEFSKTGSAITLDEFAFASSGIEKFECLRRIEAINQYCFEKCKNLNYFCLPKSSSFKTIDSHVFESSCITEITIPSNIYCIKTLAFHNCKNLRLITFECDCVCACEYAFLGCSNIEEVHFQSLTIYLNEDFYIYLLKDKISKQLIKIMTSKNDSLIKDFYCLEKSHLDKIDSLKYLSNNCFIEAKGNCYYFQNNENQKKLICCDLNAESINVSKETEIIKSNALKYSNLKKVKFEKGSHLKIIKRSSFESLLIEEITIPNSVTFIGESAFYNCRSLKKVTIKKSSQLETIGNKAFEKTSIETILLPSTLKTIGDYAFNDCTNLKTVNNKSLSISFGYKSFCNTPIEKIKFPSDAFFDYGAFSECLNLKQLTFREKPTKIVFSENSFAFSGIEELKFKNCSVEIHRNAFLSCKSLKKIQLNGDDILCFGSSFLSSNINACVINLSNLNDKFDKYKINDWNNCYEYYNNVQYSEEEIENCSYFSDLFFSNIDKCLITLNFTGDKTYELFLNHRCYVNNDSLIYADLIDNFSLFEEEELQQEESFKKNEILRIPSKAKCLKFPMMSHIKKIVWGPNCIVEEFGFPNFFSYHNLVEITIPKLIKIIPPHSFEHCHFLTNVEFEEESILEKIEDFAFANTRIKKLNLPKSVKEIGNSAFSNIKELEEVYFEGQLIGKQAFSSSGIKAFDVSNNVICINESAFQYCRSLTQVNIDIEKSNLERICPFAFSETSIESINIPPLIKMIKKGTFCGCEKLRVVNISDKSQLKIIKDISFAGDLSLERINLPKTIKKIDFSSFINTPLLRSIMNESNENYQLMDDNSIYMNDKSLLFVPRNLKQFEVSSNCKTIHSGSFCGPILEEVKFADDSLTCIESCAFAHSTSLKEIKIPKSTTSIGDDAFIQCENLEKIEFDSKCQIKQIPKFCFAFSALKSITLPSSIEVIDHSSFLLCQNLKSVNLNDTKTKYIGDYAFAHTSIDEIAVPSSLNYIASHVLDGTESLKLIDLSKLNDVVELKQFPYFIKNIIRDYLNTSTNDEPDANSNSNDSDKLSKSSAIHLENQKLLNSLNALNKITPNKSASVIKSSSPQIIKPNLQNNGQPLASANKAAVKGSSSLLGPAPLPDIGDITNNNNNKNDDNDDKANSDSLEIEPNCFIHSLAFNKASVKVLKMSLNKYKWFNFMNNFSQIDKLVINDEIHLNLQKLAKENHLNKRYISSLYDVKKFIYENEECFSPALQITPFHFVDCTQLTTIEFGDDIGVKEIPKNCFSFSVLQEMTIPSSVQTINENAFRSCYNLEVFNIPESSELNKIKTAAFYDCNKLTSFYIPNKVKVIPRKCFTFTGLEKIDFGDSIIKINSFAFYGCKNLKEINLNDGIRKIGSFTFANNGSLESINLPDSLKTIESSAFSYCLNLSIVKTTENTQLIEICDGAFENTKIEEIGLNRSATKLFGASNVPKLNKITFYKGEPENFIQLEDGTVYEKTTKFDGFCESINEDELNELESKIIKNILMNQSKTYFNESTENNNDNKSLKLNNLNIALIKNQMKNKHPLLNLVFAPKNLECLKIHEDCFSINNSILDDLNDLSTIEYMNGLTNSIINFPNYNHLFTGKFNKLNHIKILGEFAFMEEKVFADFESLETVEFSESTNILVIPKFAFLNCKNLQNISIPSSCISIEEGSFKNCINLHSVEFDMKKSSQLRFIGKESFYNCSSLESILIPSSINAICEGSFMNCTKLEKVEFDSKGENSEQDERKWLKIIEKNAFKNCSSLSSFILPKTCVELGPAAFMNCTSLETFEYLGNELKSIPCRLFYNCSSLKKFELLNIQYKNEYKRFGLKSVTIFPFSIGDESFMNCTSLKEVAFEDESKEIKLKPIIKNLKYPPLIKGFKRQSIHKNAFRNCTSLEKARFYLGNLERFYDNSFMDCSSLKLIEINSIYSNLVITENLNPTVFVGSNEDLQIKVFSESECIKTMQNFTSKTINRKSGKKVFEKYLSKLNESLFEWDIQKGENCQKIQKIKSTCIKTFDGPGFRMSFTYQKKNENRYSDEYSRKRNIINKIPFYSSHFDPLKDVNPIKIRSRNGSQIVHLLNDAELIKPDENGRIKKSEIVFVGFKNPVFKSRQENYIENLSKLNKSFLTWPMPGDVDIEDQKKNESLKEKSGNEENSNSSKSKKPEASKAKKQKKIPAKKAET